jgi:hypothetical protein
VLLPELEVLVEMLIGLRNVAGKETGDGRPVHLAATHRASFILNAFRKFSSASAKPAMVEVHLTRANRMRSHPEAQSGGTPRC